MLPKPPPPLAAAPAPSRPKRRGNYNCGRCGLPKRGHVCALASDAPASAPLRRALSFDDVPLGEAVAVRRTLSSLPTSEEDEDEDDGDDEAEEEELVGMGDGGALTMGCAMEVLRRLSPRELMGTAAVCRGWRECVRGVWRSAEELRLRLSPPRSDIGFVGSVINKCTSLVRLALTIESDADATILACIAFSCPNLEAFELNVAGNGVNRITGAELERFVAEKHYLSTLKIEGCSNLGFLSFSSSSLSTLWLSDLYCVSKSVMKCPNLRELSLDFSQQENDTTDLVSMLESVGQTCLQLRNFHIASVRLCNQAVLALTSSNIRDMHMLSLVLGSKITDAAVTSIVSSYANLELLDLSGSSISDSGIRMICNVYPETLSRLLVALCPNVTSSEHLLSLHMLFIIVDIVAWLLTTLLITLFLSFSVGIQFAITQLPLLQLMDCGMSICSVSSYNEKPRENVVHNNVGNEGNIYRNLSAKKQHHINQKLIIKHGNLRKLSLWGCSALEALHLNCPELNDLNLNECTNLHPGNVTYIISLSSYQICSAKLSPMRLSAERFLLQCPNLKYIHASGCQDMLIGAIRNQVLNEFTAIEDRVPSKRRADGSKRVQVPHFIQQTSEDEKQKSVKLTQCVVHHE